MRVDLYNQQKEKIDTIEIPDKIFGVSWKPALVHQALTAFRANQRKPIAHTKDRSEVSGGGRKPWRQKHTGRSRHGSTRSPLWRHGGVTFGPRNEKIFEQKINKKMKQGALYSILSQKMKEKEIYIVNNFDIEKPKTKNVIAILKSFFNKAKKYSALFVVHDERKNITLGGRNIPGVAIVNKNSLNIYDCATHKYIMFEKNSIPT